VAPVLTDVDYGADGKQVTELRVPCTRDSAGLGCVAIPIAVICGGPGPTALLTAGTHGDEYEGQVALLRLARELAPDEVRGRLVILPALNYPAAAAGRRLSPVDGRDLNRCYPGDQDGTVTQVIAHYVEHVLFPVCDAVLDHHSAGYSMRSRPFMVVHDAPDRTVTERSLALADAYLTDTVAIWRGADAGKNLLAAAERRGLPAVCAEIGAGGHLSPATLKMTESGVRNALRMLGILEGRPVRREERGLAPARLLHTPSAACDVYAPVAGVYEAFHEPGAEVEAGQAAGAIHAIDEPTRPPTAVEFRYTGYLLLSRGPGRVERGDGLGTVAGAYPT
jgi:N-alpha-acetyl-L-2,4-diaminobutyrate deacetylase